MQAANDEKSGQPKARESKQGAINRRNESAFGLPRLLLAVSITLLAFVILLQPSTVNMDTALPRETDKKTALILTAHPDDEVMFFTPTILALLDAGWEVDALCLSNGNGDGLGEVREKELYRAFNRLGVPAEHVTVLNDPRLQDGMNNHWASSHVSHVLDHHLKAHPASIIITFDPIGITHHPNHIALAHGCSFGPRHTPGQCYALQSPHLFTKFTGPAWPIWYTILHRYSSSDSWQKQEREKVKRTFRIVNTPAGWLKGALAMSEHTSQLVWFRYLYFAASRLVWYNELEELLEHG